jgi:hypothetical protein
MHSPVSAIVWEIWAKNRRTLLVAFGLIPLCALGQNVIPPGKEMASFTQSLCVMITVVSVIWVCSYTANDSRGRFSGFPSWMYTLPLRTSLMVMWPVLLGAVLISAAVSLWEITICRYWGIPIEAQNLGWHVLLMIGCMAWIQALVWSLHRFRWIRIVALVAIIYGFIYVGLVGHVWKFQGGASLWFGGVSIGTLLAVVAAIAGVERDRRGEWVGWTGRLLEFILDSIPRRRGGFPSPAKAQLWFEWRRRGILLGVFLGVPLPLAMMLIPLPEALYLDPIETLVSFSLPFWFLLFIAQAIGGAVAKSDPWSAELSLHPLVATKPQSTAALVFAKMKSAAAITALGWILFIILSVPVIAWCNQANWPNEQARRFWPDFAINFPRVWKWISNPLVIVAMLVVTWHGITQAMSVTLTGSKSRVLRATWTAAIVWALLIAVAVWAFKEPDRTRVLLFFRVLPVFTIALLGWKLFRAITAFAAARRLLSRRHFYVLFGLWLTVAALVLIAALVARVDAGISSTILWFVVILQIFPAEEIPACVVALAGNRHR